MRFVIEGIRRGSGPKPALLCGTAACKGEDAPVDQKTGVAIVRVEDGQRSFVSYACRACFDLYQQKGGF